MNQEFEIRRVTSEMEKEIAVLFNSLEKAGEGAFFQPHPFTREEASKIANYEGEDFFALAFHNGKAVAYGLLRGWDEGYEIPSLGISVHPDYRGGGIGLVLMHYLHAVGTLRGSEKMRLRVSRDNYRAKSLYEKLGYKFEDDDKDAGSLVGFLKLKQLREKREASSS